MSSSAATKSWGRIDFVWNYGHNTTSWEQIIDVSVSKKYKETSVLDLKSLMMRLFSSLHKKIAPLSFVRERNALVARFAMHSHLWIEVKFSFPELWWCFFFLREIIFEWPQISYSFRKFILFSYTRTNFLHLVPAKCTIASISSDS